MSRHSHDAEQPTLQHVMVVGGTVHEWGALTDEQWRERVQVLGTLSATAGARWLTLRPFERGGDADQALAIHARHVAPAVSAGMPINVVTDGASLLWRLRAYGHAVPEGLWEAAAAYAGVHPRHEQSGMRASSRLSKQGCPAVRRYLYLAAMSAVRGDPVLRAWRAMETRYRRLGLARERHEARERGTGAIGAPHQAGLGARRVRVRRHVRLERRRQALLVHRLPPALELQRASCT